MLTILGVLTLSTFLLLVFDLLRILSYAREFSPALALSKARIARQDGVFYPAILVALNPLRMLTAPIGWALFQRAETRC